MHAHTLLRNKNDYKMIRPFVIIIPLGVMTSLELKVFVQKMPSPKRRTV